MKLTLELHYVLSVLINVFSNTVVAKLCTYSYIFLTHLQEAAKKANTTLTLPPAELVPGGVTSDLQLRMKATAGQLSGVFNVSVTGIFTAINIGSNESANGTHDKPMLTF